MADFDSFSSFEEASKAFRSGPNAGSISTRNYVDPNYNMSPVKPINYSPVPLVSAFSDSPAGYRSNIMDSIYSGASKSSTPYYGSINTPTADELAGDKAWSSTLVGDSSADQLDNFSTPAGDSLWGDIKGVLGDKGLMGNLAGLAGALTQFAGMKSQKKLAKAQIAALKQNMATAREEQDRRRGNIASFNAHGKPSQPTSAFA